MSFYVIPRDGIENNFKQKSYVNLCKRYITVEKINMNQFFIKNVLNIN